jgi:hypothetical protein
VNVSIIGTVYNMTTWQPSSFDVEFSFTGGTYVAAGCDSELLNVHVSGFHATIGGAPLASPTDFTAGLTTTPYPCGGQVYAGFGGGPLLLESTGALFSPGSKLDGALGYYGDTPNTYMFSAAAFTVATPGPPVATPEPSTAGLMLLGLALVAVLLRRKTPPARGAAF